MCVVACLFLLFFGGGGSGGVCVGLFDGFLWGGGGV